MRNSFQVLKPWQAYSRPLLVAVSGGSGSGKTRFCNALAALGADVVNADLIARELLAPHQPLTEAVVAQFGEKIRGADGGIDRKRLAQVVFSDPNCKRRLDALTHPAIRARALELLHASKQPVAIYDVPLLIESQAAADVAVVIVVTAAHATRLQRIRVRDQLTEEAAQQRLNAQRPQAELIAAANIVVENDGDEHDLEQQAVQIYQLLLRETAAK